MVKRVGQDDRTRLVPEWMPSPGAKRQLETLLADLQQGSSALNMYTIAVNAREGIKPLPHNFAMPKIGHHDSDKRLARIHWQQMGEAVALHAKHLNMIMSPTKNRAFHRNTLSLQQPERKHKYFMALLANCTSLLNMYQAKDKACAEFLSGRG